METRAHHLLIGFFMLIMILGLGAFVIWLAKVDVDQKYKQYLIVFEGSVAGLNEGSPVRLNGVAVGTVLDISIPPADPSRVAVTVRIEADVPILEGSVASLELQGFTGIAYVQVKGGTGTPIVAEKENVLPVIPSERSPIQQVFEEAPNLINEAILAINNLREILGPENRQTISAILANLATVTGALADRSDEIDHVLRRLESALAAFESMAASIDGAAGAAQVLLEGDAAQTFAEAREAAAAARRLMDDLEAIAADNREGISRFVNTGLPETTRLIADLRGLSARIEALVRKFEERPQDALFGGKVPEVGAGGQKK